MAQIWLTYEELGEFCGCASYTARSLVIDKNWSRRKSGDGLTRVKLPEAMMRDYIGRMAANWQGVNSLDIDMRRSVVLPPLAKEDTRVLDGNMSEHIDHDAIADHTSRSLRAVLPRLQTGAVRTRSA